MRQNKYRAWDKKNREMIDMEYPTYSASPECDGHISDLQWFFGCLSEDSMFADGNRYVLMQYTGLKDKKNVEICEDDIVDYLGQNLIVGFANGHFLIFPGTKRKDMFKNDHFDLWKALGRITASIKYDNKVEIIGNIYENKNLLKKQL